MVVFQTRAQHGFPNNAGFERVCQKMWTERCVHLFLNLFPFRFFGLRPYRVEESVAATRSPMLCVRIGERRGAYPASGREN